MQIHTDITIFTNIEFEMRIFHLNREYIYGTFALPLELSCT